MTSEEILKMETGPELDRLVAERVMGWEYDLLRDAWFKDRELVADLSSMPSRPRDWSASWTQLKRALAVLEEVE